MTIFRLNTSSRFEALSRERAVAQLVSALDWGSRGPGFKSRQPDSLRLSAGTSSRAGSPRVRPGHLKLEV